jgi:uncharacterized protein
VLSPDLVRVRRRGERLEILPLTGPLRARAALLAEQVLELLTANIGRTRGELAELWAGIELQPRENKVFLGLKKLAEDQSEFSGAPALDAPELRRQVFSRAAEARAGLVLGQRFDADSLLSAVASELGLEPAVLGEALYGDLRSAERLLRAAAIGAEALLSEYERAQVQALFLCAVRVVADVHCANADAYRTLFQKLKFRQLLFRLSALDQGGYRIEIDGPYSLFDRVTKYGLELALTLPALLACEQVRVSAELRWGKRRDALRFDLEARAAGIGEPASARSEVVELMQAFAGRSDWLAEPAHEILELPGIGLCIPDLVLTQRGKRKKSARILLEVLGFWSREAVWRRVELVERGLARPIVFAVSSRLRVSEAVLGDADSAALYVYKGRINPNALVRKLDGLVGHMAK